MKKLTINLMILMIAVSTNVPAQMGGIYTLTQSVIASGGGQNSSGGTFTIDGTVGQAVAGQAIGNSPFTINAGFWNPSFAPTAAAASIGGKITSASGAGIRNVVVTLIGASGELRTTVSGVGGYFNFADVPSGANYVISVSAKRYQFLQNSQVVNLTESITDINFVATTGNYVPLPTIITTPNN